MRESYGREAQTLLLGRMSSSLKIPAIVFDSEDFVSVVIYFFWQHLQPQSFVQATRINKIGQIMLKTFQVNTQVVVKSQAIANNITAIGFAL